MNEIQKLQARRNEIVEAIGEMDAEASRVEIYEMHGEIEEIDRALHAINPSLV